MRTILFFLIASICSIFISSCGSQPKSRIEQKFQNYVNENFGNPKDLVEIVSITKTDSFDILGHIDILLSSNQMEYLSELYAKYGEALINLAAKLPSSKKYELSKKVLPLINEKSSTIYSDLASYNTKREKLIRLVNDIDSTFAVSREYLIKARVRTKDEVVVKKFYVMDCCVIDSVMISESSIKTSELPPQTLEILIAIEEYWGVIKKQLDLNDQLSNLIKEYEIYTH